MFIISKPDGSLQSLSDLREHNKRIKRYPFPIPKIQDMLQKLEGYKFAQHGILSLISYTQCLQAMHSCTAMG